MSSQLEFVLEQLRGAWRFRRIGILAAWLIATIGWVFVCTLPDWYQASARLFVDTRTSLKPVLQGLAVQEDANQQINYVRQTLMGSQQLEQVARETGLLSPAVADPVLVRKTIDAMRRRMNVRIQSANEQEGFDSAGSIYSLSYQDLDRERAVKVVQLLFSALVGDTRSGKRENAVAAQRFLEVQLRDYEARLRTAEERLADFKKRNLGMMPADQGGYFARLQTEMDAVRTSETALSVAESRRDELMRQLRGETVVTASSAPAASDGGSGGNTAGKDTAARLREAQARLDELRLKFTDRYPDVVAARESLEELKRRRADEIASLRRGDPSAAVSSGVGANPVYQSVQLGLNQADVEIAMVRRQLDDHRSKVAELKRSLNTMPQIEAEYASLNRDYDVNKAQYNGLLVQFEKAKLGEEADSNGPAKFKMIEPATADFAPVAPQRFLMVPAILVLALSLGAGVAYVLNLMRPVVWSSRTVLSLPHAETLGFVGTAFPGALRRRKQIDFVIMGAAGGGLMAVCVAVMHLMYAGLRLSASGLG